MIEPVMDVRHCHHFLLMSKITHETTRAMIVTISKIATMSSRTGSQVVNNAASENIKTPNAMGKIHQYFKKKCFMILYFFLYQSIFCVANMAIPRIMKRPTLPTSRA